MFEDELEDGDGSPRLSHTPLIGSNLPPQPLFPSLRTSQSQDCEASTSKSLFGRKSDDSRIPRLSTSHPLRARANTDAERPTLGSKKAISLDAITISARNDDEPFGHPISNLGKKSRPISSSSHALEADTLRRAHKRINSGDYLSLAGNGSISRSTGHKSGLALSLNLTPSPAVTGLPDLASNSSLSSLSTAGLTPPASAFSPAEPPIFEDVKPLAEAFEQPAATVSRKFKPRDSGVAMGDEDKSAKSLVPPPSVMKPSARPRRPAMLKRTSSMGAERLDVETPSLNPSAQSGWPGAQGQSQPFNFLGEGAVNMTFTAGAGKPSMPNTPVKKHAYGHSHGGGPFGHRVGHSMSHPSLNSESSDVLPSLQETTRTNIPTLMMPPPSTKKPPPSVKVPHLTLTTTSSPDSPSPMDTDQPSPTVRVGAMPTALVAAPASRVSMLRRTSSGAGSSESEEEATPTKNTGDRVALAGEF